MANNMEPVKFLIVDDDEVDIMSIKRSMRQLKLANPVTVAKDGIEALEFLRGEAGKDQILPPYFITLDLNMPRMDGHEFLKAVRDDPVLHSVVIFVWSTSEAVDDIDAAYSKNVAGYIVKEQGTEAFKRALAMLNQYAQLIVFPKPVV